MFLGQTKCVKIVIATEKPNLEIRVERIGEVADVIQRDVRDVAKLGADTKALAEDMSQRVENAERKTDKVENRLWHVAIAVIVAGGMPALISRFFS